jgi:hypothetical protein
MAIENLKLGHLESRFNVQKPQLYNDETKELMNVEEAGGEGAADPQLGARVEAHHHPHREYTIIILYSSNSISPDG